MKFVVSAALTHANANKFRIQLKRGVDMDAKDFKVGDKVVFKYASMSKELMTIECVSLDGSCVDVIENKYPLLAETLCFASKEEIAAGHRIDEVVPVYANPQFAYTMLSGAQVGSVLQIARQVDDMGDDSNLQHHPSPFCEVRDV
ncbi:hypothetical protein [Acinetobacter baumannii]|uniref:hypothetical protein n=1 Tax=Acinetobacter baumannii TaxID=470 RepID=UPI001177406A|nr:hypothetical protein [Acinetobacter baumannii]HCV3101331.1 hypothetical protein [Acinetobacter baumannii]HCV3123896.1 hypothetical protein [Acinetobacter baumannii]HCV3147424.1 hypothetical protein [Acinetobacter baumannii]HCV3168231.1 hypothetical protein [Acinetobacter baumannii]HCV3289883.1 hypothetical protein [Acinetobacter baumannii]